ncbi:MAG: CopG family transcriptional regulator, partial [Methanobacteriota archaeon]
AVRAAIRRLLDALDDIDERRGRTVRRPKT